ncbi:endonuclease domain-containing protein [bacterium]|nr:endonuclease domain-containing protein [bacterium]MBU1634428.1 endonuclease domain-containing protein [bacterium]MBU1875477.1 endonuclease domain-containing protein [bacterium]
MPRKSQAKRAKEVLVALLPRISSLEILQTEKWYHIPVDTAPQKRWPPKVLAFYQGKVFGYEEAFKIRYFGEVDRIDIVPRKELFPDDEKNVFKADKLYYRLQLKSLEERETPIISYSPRRIVFIPTTTEKFVRAEQINDLFDGSPLEDKLWSVLKFVNILAERQWRVFIQGHRYFLDFAVFCKNGKLAIETDGYSTHFDSMNQIDHDTWRQNEIEMDDWRFLHYTTNQVKEDWTPYLSQIEKKIEQLGGPENPQDFARKVGEKPVEYIIDGEEPL